MEANGVRHCETSGVCAAASRGARRREGRWCGHGRTEQAARHVLTRRVRRARAWGRAQQSNNDLCKALRVASSASHNNRTATATRRAMQRAHAGLASAAPHCHAQGDGSKQLKGTATGNTQGAQARTATLIHLPLVEVALALVQRGGLAMAHAHRSAAAEHGERCSHYLFAAAAPHPGKQQHATKWKVKFHTRHRTHPRVTAHTTQLSAQAHLAHACVSLPRKRTHTVTAATPQAREHASNSAATSAAASTVASSAVALRSATAECAVARHAVSSRTSHAARGAPSAQRHGAAHPLSLHRIGSATTRARLLSQHT
ncbi:hypothetical protein, conserved in T. vivax, partial [Trypanosoma vivax Y486]